VLATAALSAGYGLAGLWPWLVAPGGLGLVWLGGYWRDWFWITPLGLIGFAVAAAAGLLQGLGAGWMVLGLVAALCAWDLHYLVRTLQALEPAKVHRRLEWSHIQRLSVVAGLSLVLAAVALTIEVRFTFLVALFLGLLAVWGLGRVVGFLRHESD
jgi:hypothetical protein